MAFGIELLSVVFVLSGVAFGEANKTKRECPPTYVDCACPEKNGNYYGIQINITTSSIIDENTGLNRCIADGDPKDLCEKKGCLITPNNNFDVLFKKGKKMPPSNFLHEKDLVFENKTSKNKDVKAGPVYSEDMMFFFPIEITYSNLLKADESRHMVKRSNVEDTGSLIPPPDSDVGSRSVAQSSESIYGNEKKGPTPFKRPSDSDFGEDRYKKNDTDSYNRFKDQDAGAIKYRNKDSVYNIRSNGADFGDDKFGIMQPQSNVNSNFGGQSISLNSNSGPNYWKGNTDFACRIPQMKNSEVTCWKWPNWQTCQQNCIYGHGLTSSTGTLRSTSYTCRNSENTWKPHRMTDCQPYLNCKVRLRSPGDLKCVEPTNKPAYCDISCEEYDDNSAQKVRVTCDEKQGGMRLPFCAVLDNKNANQQLGYPPS